MFQDNRVEIGVFGGHMNNHPVGQMVLYRLLNDLDKRLCRITLIATPLRPDEVTKHIASVVHNIVNLPLNTKQAWAAIDQLSIDVMLFPDWQPFPDQQSLLFQSRFRYFHLPFCHSSHINYSPTRPTKCLPTRNSSIYMKIY